MHGVKRERIIRVLLNQPEGNLTKYRVAKLADCSTSWTIEYLQNLEKKGLVESTKVIEFESLIEHWASMARRSRYFDFFVQSPTEFLKKIKLEYALTTYLAENMLNHFLFPSRADVYIRKEDIEAWKEAIIGSGMVGKGNLRLLINDPHVLYGKQKIEKLWIASTPQVMLDLKREGGVCEEAYELMVRKYVRGKRN